MATGCAGGVIGVAAMESTLPKPQETALQRTVLFDLHERLGAKIVPFAGYEMPVQYPAGIMQEHLHTRAAAGLFDVSHMGQAWLDPLDEAEDAASLFEALVPGGIATLAEGRIRYTQLTNPQGGILDDLMATRFGNRLWLVVNAACKESDFAHIETALAGRAPSARAGARFACLAGAASGQCAGAVFTGLPRADFHAGGMDGV